MGRIWFKERMIEAIKAGRKTTTARRTKHRVGVYDTVHGSWFKPEKWGVTIEITEVEPEPVSVRDLCEKRFESEGFDSITDCIEFFEKEYGHLPEELYIHHIVRRSTDGDKLFEVPWLGEKPVEKRYVVKG